MFHVSSIIISVLTFLAWVAGYDMVHLKVVLEQLACLHASSYHWIQTYPGGLKRFKKDFWPMNG